MTLHSNAPPPIHCCVSSSQERLRASDRRPRDTNAPLLPATAMRPSSSRLPRSSSARSLSSCTQQQGRAPSKPAELLRALPPFSRSDEALAAPSPASLLDSPRKQVGRRAGAMGPRSCWRDCAVAAAGSWSVAIHRAAAPALPAGAPCCAGPPSRPCGAAAGRRRQRRAAGRFAGTDPPLRRHGCSHRGSQLPRAFLCARRAGPPLSSRLVHFCSHALARCAGQQLWDSQGACAAGVWHEALPAAAVGLSLCRPTVAGRYHAPCRLLPPIPSPPLASQPSRHPPVIPAAQTDRHWR